MVRCPVCGTCFALGHGHRRDAVFDHPACRQKAHRARRREADRVREAVTPSTGVAAPIPLSGALASADALGRVGDGPVEPLTAVTGRRWRPCRAADAGRRAVRGAGRSTGRADGGPERFPHDRASGRSQYGSCAQGCPASGRRAVMSRSVTSDIESLSDVRRVTRSVRQRRRSGCPSTGRLFFGRPFLLMPDWFAVLAGREQEVSAPAARGGGDSEANVRKGVPECGRGPLALRAVCVRTLACRPARIPRQPRRCLRAGRRGLDSPPAPRSPSGRTAPASRFGEGFDRRRCRTAAGEPAGVAGGAARVPPAAGGTRI